MSAIGQTTNKTAGAVASPAARGAKSAPTAQGAFASVLRAMVPRPRAAIDRGLPAGVPAVAISARRVVADGEARASSTGHAKDARHVTRRRAHDDADALDPQARNLAQLGPPPGLSAAVVEPTKASEAAARVSMETLLPALVSRIAWSRQGTRSGAVRLEIGTGALAGGTLLIQSAAGRVSVQLSGVSGIDAEAWRTRIAHALAERGVEVDSIEVQ